jgi:hypothetical protein
MMTEEEFNVALDAVRNGKGPQDKNWWFVYGAIARVHNAFVREPGNIPSPGWIEPYIDRLDEKGRRTLKKIAEGKCTRLELYWWLITDELSKARPSHLLLYVFLLGFLVFIGYVTSLFVWAIVRSLWSLA